MDISGMRGTTALRHHHSTSRHVLTMQPGSWQPGNLAPRPACMMTTWLLGLPAYMARRHACTSWQGGKGGGGDCITTLLDYYVTACPPPPHLLP